MIVGIGTDIAEVNRIEALWKDNPDGLARKVFTQAEIDYCLSRQHPAQHLAARFAVKEAALKALGTGWGKGIGFTDIEVVRNEDGAPSLVFHGKTQAFLDSAHVTRTHVSYSHTAEHAMATVILES